MLKWNSVPGSVLGLAFSGTIVPLWNEQILTEYREVLMRPKFHLTQEIVDGAVNEIEQRGLCIDPAALEMEFPDPKARVFYEVVMEERRSEDACLVTGDLRHFPQKPFVVMPRQMLDIILCEIEQ